MIDSLIHHFVFALQVFVSGMTMLGLLLAIALSTYCIPLAAIICLTCMLSAGFFPALVAFWPKHGLNRAWITE